MAETSNTHSTQARIDRTNQTVVSGPRRTQLTPKAFAVLDFLRQHPGQLVTKDDLLSAVWPRVVVGDAVLKVAVGEIRKALEDDPQTPRFVQTVHRRGYRFIGALPEIEAVPAPMPQLPLAEPRLGASAFPGLIGRVREFTQLDEYWASALQGKRQIVFIGGEPGVGKTTLADAWLNALVADTPKLLHAKGGCLEQYGGSEAYLAVLDALGRLCRNAQSPRLKELLGQYAPSWLVQLPALLATDAEREELRQRLFGSTRERMLREMTEFLEALTTDTPLVLLLEDVHWADNATLDLLAFVARRNEPARLCIVATLRNTEVNDSAHPLKRLRQELIAHRQCRDLALDFFTTREVSDYLQQRLGHSDIPYGLAEILYLHTSGHPLFLASAVDYLLATGALTAHGERWALTAPPDAIALAMPGELRQILERQIAELNPFERRVLDAASVARDRFAAAALAVMLEADAIEVEDACERFARRGLWLARLETERWPDATVTESYRFGHALYRNYFYDTLPAARRQRFHLRLAERLEQAFGLQANTVAADLAYHFEQGGALERAVHFLQRAADLDSARFALREAARHLEHALLLLESGGAAQDALRAALRERRCQLLLSTGELPSAIGGYRQLAATARDQGDAAREVRALLGLGHALFWIDRDQCLAVAEQALECTTALPDALLKAHARGWRAHWQSLIRGYHPDHAGAYTDAVNAAHAAGDRRLECQHVALEALSVEPLLALSRRAPPLSADWNWRARPAMVITISFANSFGRGVYFTAAVGGTCWPSSPMACAWRPTTATAPGLPISTCNGHSCKSKPTRSTRPAPWSIRC
ncbi:MAG: AAA family ATPase [Gammaproteobacteria bacterium]